MSIGVIASHAVVGSAWTPRSISSLVAWYSAEAETAYADAADMTQWTDQSGLGHHAPVAGGATKPRWRSAGGPGGGPSVEFLGLGQSGSAYGYFSVGSIFGAATAIEAHYYVQANSAVTNNGFCYMDTGTEVSHYPFSGTVYDRFGSTVRRSFTPTLAVTSWRRYNVWSAANDWAARLDAVTQLTASSNTVAVPTAPLIGGNVAAPADWRFGGRMTAVLLFNAKLSTADRDALDSWMAAHPSGGTP